MIVFAETNAGKTRFYMMVADAMKNLKVSPEKFRMIIINTDRPSGVSKLIKLIPPEYLPCVSVVDVSNYEELISATTEANEILEKHYREVGPNAFMCIELLGEPWVYSQDYYTRKAHGESLGDYFATKKQLEKAVRDDVSAYKAIDGWKDWPVIKFLHNVHWMDKLKKVPYHVIFTAEVKEVENEKSIFNKTGKPAGEKRGIHRVDEIVFLGRVKGKYLMKAIKLTGYSARYKVQDITGKNAYLVHEEQLKLLEEHGYKDGVVASVEKKSGITPPKKPAEEAVPEPPKTEPKTEKEESQKTPPKVAPDKAPSEGSKEETKKEPEKKTIEIRSKEGPEESESTEKISKEELVNEGKEEATDTEEDDW